MAVDERAHFWEMGKDVNLKNAAGEPLLVVAVRYGALDTMRLLLARGANPARKFE